jgi:TolA-binding protein
MAVHLANLYSGRLDQPEKAISLLRDLVDRYPETAAAAKAAKRLEMIDGS